MIFSLLKDALGFAWRHLVQLTVLVGPILVGLVLLFHWSGIEDTLAQMSEYTEQWQREANQIPQNDAEIMDALHEVPSVPWSNALGFLVYLLVSLYPTALMMHYIRTVFDGENRPIAQIHAMSFDLWPMLVMIYAAIWFGFIVLSLSLMTVLHLIMPALAQGMTPVLMGFLLYTYYRLSFAPYFCVEQRTTALASLRLSWLYARPHVFQLLVGKILIYMAVLVGVYFLGILLSQVVSGSSIFITLLLSLIASLAGPLQTVYGYRVFAMMKDAQGRAPGA